MNTYCSQTVGLELGRLGLEPIHYSWLDEGVFVLALSEPVSDVLMLVILMVSTALTQ